jgi:hypothetical protein
VGLVVHGAAGFGRGADLERGVVGGVVGGEGLWGEEGGQSLPKIANFTMPRTFPILKKDINFRHESNILIIPLSINDFLDPSLQLLHSRSLFLIDIMHPFDQIYEFFAVVGGDWLEPFAVVHHGDEGVA